MITINAENYRAACAEARARCRDECTSVQVLGFWNAGAGTIERFVTVATKEERREYMWGDDYYDYWDCFFTVHAPNKRGYISTDDYARDYVKA